MSLPSSVVDLIARFEQNITDYRSGQYNETQVRREFIDPFFLALGWDVQNQTGAPQAYKDVIHEDAIKIGGVTKAPDYCFRIGGIRQFFVEAKKPSINLRDDFSPAFQLRRYAWSANLPVSILTDFEELAVYDCRVQPMKNDRPSAARIYYFHYTEYLDHWDKIASLFERDAVLAGSLEQFAESTKKGTATVDSAFLKEIEIWRERLACNVALRNAELSQRHLNFAVQMIIDRIIFLRICEDRGIEPYGRLQDIGRTSHIYEQLCQLFRQADERYNSGLFHFEDEKAHSEPPDNLTPNLNIDNETLKPILDSLYYPDSPYEFAVMPIEILGQAYEQFLGKVIQLTDERQVVVEDKPEIRKAGGVYYTPTYVVNYIVKNTVGKLVENKKPTEVEKLTVLDPACGSGSFLIGAYQYLLDWHRDWYLEHGTKTDKRTKLHQTIGGEWRLTTSERKRILLNNIYGVDIDPQAVEVTKLSLLLKVLEGESEQTLASQLRLFHERALPDLGENIKNGNSLIGSDFYLNYQLSLDEEELLQINAFDWTTEFSEIIADGGFDVIIGNPPWGAQFSERELDYLRQTNRPIIVRMIDSFMYFVYQGSNKLKTSGYLGMILPDVILYQKDNYKLREFILNNYRIDVLLNMGNVFEQVTRPAAIVIMEKGEKRQGDIAVADFSSADKFQKQTLIWAKSQFEVIKQGKLIEIPSYLFVTSDPTKYLIWAQVNNVSHMLLGDLVDEDGIQRGVSPDLKKAFIVDSETAEKWELETGYLRRVLTGGKQVKRYSITYQDLWLIYTSRSDEFRKTPNICTYIDQFKDEITCKEVAQRKHPLYSLHRPRTESIFLKPHKIVGVITEDEIVVALDEESYFTTDGLYSFGIRDGTDPRYILGILNSRLFVFVYRLLALEKGRALAQVKPTTLLQVPIRTIDFSDPTDKVNHDRIVELVEHIQALHRQLGEVKTTNHKMVIQRQIRATDRQIDQLVYDLYKLKSGEINMVEQAT